jgi:hypothetical protein
MNAGAAVPRSPTKRPTTTSAVAVGAGTPVTSSSLASQGQGRPIGGLLGSGLGFGLKANFENGEADGSSGR